MGKSLGLEGWNWDVGTQMLLLSISVRVSICEERQQLLKAVLSVREEEEMRPETIHRPPKQKLSEM